MFEAHIVRVKALDKFHQALEGRDSLPEFVFRQFFMAWDCACSPRNAVASQPPPVAEFEPDKVVQDDPCRIVCHFDVELGRGNRAKGEAIMPKELVCTIPSPL